MDERAYQLGLEISQRLGEIDDAIVAALQAMPTRRERMVAAVASGFNWAEIMCRLAETASRKGARDEEGHLEIPREAVTMTAIIVPQIADAILAELDRGE